MTAVGSGEKGNDRIQTVCGFGVNKRFNASSSSQTLGRTKADRRLGHFRGARIGRHDKNDIAEVDLLAVVIRE